MRINIPSHLLCICHLLCFFFYENHLPFHCNLYMFWAVWGHFCMFLNPLWWASIDKWVEEHLGYMRMDIPPHQLCNLPFLSIFLAKKGIGSNCMDGLGMCVPKWGYFHRQHLKNSPKPVMGRTLTIQIQLYGGGHSPQH